jgi:hypothetical protein
MNLGRGQVQADFGASRSARVVFGWARFPKFGR